MKGKNLIRLDPTLLGENVLGFERFLQSNIIGQRMAIKRLVDAYALSFSSLRPDNEPIFAGIFLGPSGVGKTKTAEMVSKFIFHDENAMTKIACAEYIESHQISRLFGSPPGYIGYDDNRDGKERNPSLLSQRKINEYCNQRALDYAKKNDPETKKNLSLIDELDEQRNKIRSHIANLAKTGTKENLDKIESERGLLKMLDEQHDRLVDRYIGRISRITAHLPDYSLVLFDEVEKAHPRILDALLEITSKAQATMSNGEKTSFRDSFVIMTSNIGSAEIADSLKGKHSIGFANSAESSVYNIAMEELKKYFRPELIGRIKENVVVFDQLSHSDLRKIIGIQIKQLAYRMLYRGKISVTVHPRVNRFIFERSCDHPQYGARLIEQKIQSYISKPLAKLSGSGQISIGDSVLIDVDQKNDRLIFLKEESNSSKIIIPNESMVEAFNLDS